jgi:monoamine oxidase
VLRAEPPGTGPFFHLGGARYDERDAVADLKAAWRPLHRDYVEAGFPTLYTSSTARGRQLDSTSVAAWIAGTVPGGLASRLGRLLAVAYTIEYGAEPEEQSALNLVYLLGASGQGQLRLFGPSNEKYKVRGGNDLLVARMAAALGGQLSTGRALARVRRAGSAWALGFDAGPEVTADRVVLALPFSVLRARVDTSGAGFPEPKRRAIAELAMGRNAKLALQFTTRHWHALGNGGDTYADTGYQATWEATRAQAGAPGILVNYTGGLATDAQTGRDGRRAGAGVPHPGRAGAPRARRALDHARRLRRLAGRPVDARLLFVLPRRPVHALRRRRGGGGGRVPLRGRAHVGRRAGLPRGRGGERRARGARGARRARGDPAGVIPRA